MAKAVIASSQDAEHEKSQLADDARVSRRGLLRGGMGTAAAATLGGMGPSACGSEDDDARSGTLEPVARRRSP